VKAERITMHFYLLYVTVCPDVVRRQGSRARCALGLPPSLQL
jgi:hypothetical protein